MKKVIVVLLLLCIIGTGYFFLQKTSTKSATPILRISGTTITPTPNSMVNPLAISSMKQKSYPGSALVVAATLTPGADYSRYIVSYLSEGLKQYGLLTVPTGQKPAGGWPVILFNHGYIPPAQYSTEISYASFVNPLASAGYIVFKPDYRGNGNSEGTPMQIYVSADYLVDSMNALASIKQYKDANPQKIGVFGHSMGGNITLHELVISKDIQAAELMAGVVGDETGILNWWNQRISAKSIIGNDLDTSYIVQQMIADYGTPVTNPQYWNAIDPTKYVSDITAPVEIQVGTADVSVPPVFSSSLRDTLQSAGKTVVYHAYAGADHNLSPDSSRALTETVAFFNQYLK